MTQQRNKVRIIAGKYRRRLLDVPEAEGLRPTPDRVRETLFNWLGQELHGKNCLDLFAGSGALGFEAASREARRVVLVEKSRGVAEVLRKNRQLLGAGEIDIQSQDALLYLKHCRCSSRCWRCCRHCSPRGRWYTWKRQPQRNLPVGRCYVR